MGIYDGGLTPWVFDSSSGLLAGTWRFASMLNTPVYVGPFEYTALAQLDLAGATQLFLLFLGTEGYVEGFWSGASMVNKKWPWIFDVKPDHPEIAWG